MFGYLFPTKNHLKLSERKIFRDYFCSICLAHRYNYGRLSISLNNYDIAFIAICLGICEDTVENCGKCGKHVGDRKKKFSDKPWSELADYNINLIRKKLDDNVLDNKSISSIIMRKLGNGIFNKCKKRNPKLYKSFDESFEKFLKLEKSDASVNMMMDGNAEFIEYTILQIFKPTTEQLLFLKSIMRWLYWIDAVNDYEDDLKNKNFNPLVQNKARDTSQELFLEYNMTELVNSYLKLKEQINYAYSMCASSYSADSRVIIENMINYTIKEVSKKILKNQPLEKKGRLL